MSRKFAHLTQLLQYYDPEFYSYLRVNGAQELLFCYRWLLLELKREFPFDDTLHMLEVLWSSMPPTDINTSLRLFDDHFLYIPNKSNSQMRPKFRSDVSLSAKSEDRLSPKLSKRSQTKPLTSRPRSIRFLPQLLSTDSKDLDSPDEDEFIKSLYRCPPPLIDKQFSVDSYSEESFSEAEKVVLNSKQKSETIEKSKNSETTDSDLDLGQNNNKENVIKTLRNVHCSGDYSDDIPHNTDKDQSWTCPVGLARSLSCESLKASKERAESYGSHFSEFGSSFSEVSNYSTKSSSCSSLVILSTESSSLSKSVSLLTPDELGANDAFMLFLCLTILLQNRDKIISNNFDANDIQMYFDGLVRKNDVISVLDFARHLFHNYLSHWHQDCQT